VTDDSLVDFDCKLGNGVKFGLQYLHRVSKNCANLFFCQNFVKFQPIAKIFGTKEKLF